MSAMKGLEWTFDTVASKYEKLRRVISASAFHWVLEKIGYEKVFSLLKHGGTITIYDTIDLQLARKC